MNIGVATQAQKDSLDQSTHYIEGETYFCNSYDCCNYFNLGLVSGSEIQIPPKSIVVMHLDCDLGTLSFALNGNNPYFTINVPKGKMLYPCVHMNTLNNSATFVV